MGQNRTIVHLVRHGEVDNPAGLLYGRLPDYHLSELGREMAERVAEHFSDRDVVHVRSSPLERAQETMAPLALNRTRFPPVVLLKFANDPPSSSRPSACTANALISPLRRVAVLNAVRSVPFALSQAKPAA